MLVLLIQFWLSFNPARLLLTTGSIQFKTHQKVVFNPKKKKSVLTSINCCIVYTYMSIYGEYKYSSVDVWAIINEKAFDGLQGSTKSDNL